MDENEQQLPVSPTGEILNTGSFSLCVHAVFYTDTPVDVSHAKKNIQEIFLAQSPRFSSIVMKNENGLLRWQKTKVDINEHVFAPEFPADETSYDESVDDYISDMHLRTLPRNRPPWEFHFLNYKTRNGEATIILNLHHLLGDGVSLMSLLLACSTRADNPSPPPSLTFTTSENKQDLTENSCDRSKCDQASFFSFEFIYKMWHRLVTLVLVICYTLQDLITSFLQMKWMEDSKFSIRGHPGVEHLPKVMASATFTLRDVGKIKNRVEGSVNDVIMGVVFCGFRRYCEMALSDHNHIQNLRVTALALRNTRSRPGLKSLEEMSKPKTGAPWGNRFGYLHMRVPMEKLGNPLEYVERAKQMTDKKKMSLAVFLTSRLLGYITRFKGPESSAKCLYNTLTNTTMTVTNMYGPTEKIVVGGYNVNSAFFSVSGVPQTILVTCMSYKGDIRMQVIAAKGYVDAKCLAKCFEEAFKQMKEASV